MKLVLLGPSANVNKKLKGKGVSGSLQKQEILILWLGQLGINHLFLLYQLLFFKICDGKSVNFDRTFGLTVENRHDQTYYIKYLGLYILQIAVTNILLLKRYLSYLIHSWTVGLSSKSHL